ncbi:MAG: hypothetical protein B2I17_05760 [Thermoplasmatales archaeon B_DKE]|nr:MAG: hypothetical protein B2I17_05760 [Thermoplasmatales archaeon B_DKE]
MNHLVISIMALLSLTMLVAVPAVSAAATPTLSPPPATLPAVVYYTNPVTGVHYTVTTPEWSSFLSKIIDNSTYVSYNWTLNVTQPLVLFDLSYTGLNPYGMVFIQALAKVGGFPSIHNMSIAFNMTKNLPSQISGYTNIQALDAGAYPGFTWSVPIVHSMVTEYEEIGAIAAIVVVMFVLYFAFNRKK